MAGEERMNQELEEQKKAGLQDTERLVQLDICLVDLSTGSVARPGDESLAALHLAADPGRDR